MGLDIICNENIERVGSYTGVHRLRVYLIKSVIKYLEDSNKFEDLEKEILVEYLNSLLSENDDSKINYDNYKGDMNTMMELYDLAGFTSFIFHSDCDGILSSLEASDFLKTYDKIKNFIDKTDYHDEETGQFYLYEVFKESSDSGEPIYFC